MPLSESQKLNRNRIFASGLERAATYAVSIGAEIFRVTVNLIRELIKTAAGMGK